MKNCLILALLLALPLRCFGLEETEAPAASEQAPTAPGREGIYLGAGFFFQNMLKVAGSSAGGRTLLGEAYFPELVAGYRFGNWFPVLGLTPFGNQLSEGNKRRGIVRLQMPFVFSRAEGSAWEWKLGPGVLFHRLYGDGGTIELGNGASTKSYFTPAGSRTTRLLYATGGVAYLNENWRYDLDLLITGLLSSRRAFSLSLGAGYVF